MRAKIDIEKLPKHTYKLKVTIPWKDIEKLYQKKLSILSKEITIPGFRKGKAPKHLVEKKINKQEVYSSIYKDLLNDAINDAVKENNIKPFNFSDVKIIKAQENQNLEAELKIAEAPVVDLKSDYIKEIKKIKKQNVDLWIPGKETKKDSKSKVEKRNERYNKLVEFLFKTIKVEISDVIVEKELSRNLAKKLEDIQKLGLTLNSYLESIGKTVEEFKQTEKKNIIRVLSLSLILDKIADDQNITITNQEIENFIQKLKDENIKNQVNKNKYIAAQILRREKTIDTLLSL